MRAYFRLMTMLARMLLAMVTDFIPFSPTIGNLAPPLTIANGGTGAVTASAALTALGGLVKQASIILAGFPLVNGTPTILSWTAPNDGIVHIVHLVSAQQVTVAETGGAVAVNFTAPDSVARQFPIFPGGSGAGDQSNVQDFLVAPGSTTSIVQTSALTAGAASYWAQLWGA